MGKFDGCLFVSDVDGTLLRTDQTISGANRHSIEYFVREGGRFTIATGRMVGEVQNICIQITINAPLILHNGSKVYDFEHQKIVWEKFVEEERKERVRRFHDEVQECGIEIYSGETVYIYRLCGETQRFFNSPGGVVYEMPDFVWGEPWQKVLIIGDDKDMTDRCEHIYRTGYDSGNCVRNGPKYLGIIAEGASKAVGMKIIAENGDDASKAATKYGAPHCEKDAVAYAVKMLDNIISYEED